MYHDFILTLYNRPYTVFTTHEVAQLFPSLSSESIQDKLHYFSRIGKLAHPYHGIYAKLQFNISELANKLYTPSYISLETVLAKAGIIFQYYETIFLSTYLTRTIKVGEQNIQYRRMKVEILMNNEGLVYSEGCYWASPERAFLDTVYVYKQYHFDHLGNVPWEKVMSLRSIYQSKTLNKRIDRYYQLFKEEHA